MFRSPRGDAETRLAAAAKGGRPGGRRLTARSVPGIVTRSRPRYRLRRSAALEAL